MKTKLTLKALAAVLFGCEKPLNQAVEEKNIEAAKQSTYAGADVNAKEDYGWTPLLWAVDEGRKKTVELLVTTIAAGLLVGCGESTQQTTEDKPDLPDAEATKTEAPDITIHDAPTTADIERARQHVTDGELTHHLHKHSGKTGTELKSAQPIPVSERPEPSTKKTEDLIKESAEDEIIETVKQDLTDGADVNAKNLNNNTLLLYAALEGQKDVVEKLIANGAHVSAKDDSAIGGTPLHWAAWEGHKEISELLLAKGAEVNAKNRAGGTPLVQAAYGGHREIIELFLSKGAEVNAQVEGKTAVDAANEGDNIETAALLRKHGGKTGAELKAVINEPERNVKPKNFKHMPEIELSEFTEEQKATILEMVNKERCDCGRKMTVAECRNDNTTCRRSVMLAKKIVEQVTGASLLKPDELMHIAAREGNIEDLKQAVLSGADVNAKNMNGNSLLHYAAWKGYRGIVELLIAKGAEVNVEDEGNDTPLDEANAGDHTEITDLLRKHGGKTGAELKAGE